VTANTPAVNRSIRIRAPIATVWDALIDPQKIEQWLNGAHVQTTWKPGSPIMFSGSLEGMTYRDKGVVLQFEPEAILQYSHWSKWSRIPDTPDNYSVVTLTVARSAADTLLAVRHENLATDEMYKHSKFHWEMTLPVLKQMLEAEQP
jgi:uncharacterized protein YndB with AHSA1/START domain